MALRINDMIREANGRKEEILRELKRLNRLALKEYFLAPGYLFGHTFKMKYKALQKSNIWKRGRELLLEYFELDDCPLHCKECGQILGDDIVIHHDVYVKEEIFTPDLIRTVSKRCHSKIHYKELFKE
jgi:hypothetical protein